MSERTSHFSVQRLPFLVQFRGASLGTEIVSTHINEMLATKMRALLPTAMATGGMAGIRARLRAPGRG